MNLPILYIYQQQMLDLIYMGYKLLNHVIIFISLLYLHHMKENLILYYYIYYIFLGY